MIDDASLGALSTMRLQPLRIIIANHFGTIVRCIRSPWEIGTMLNGPQVTRIPTISPRFRINFLLLSIVNIKKLLRVEFKGCRVARGRYL